MQTVDPQRLEMRSPCRTRSATPATAPLRFLALHAGPDVTTTYGTEVQPGGSRERRSTPS